MYRYVTCWIHWALAAGLRESVARIDDDLHARAFLACNVHIVAHDAFAFVTVRQLQQDPGQPSHVAYLQACGFAPRK